MSKLIEVPRSELTKFDPAKTKDKLAKVDAVIDYAARMKDWPLLENAVDAKIEEQRQFVAWWMANVTPRLHAGTELSAERRTTHSKKKTEEAKGIKHQQVSKWRKQTAHPDHYRELIMLATYKKANIIPADNHRAEGTGENEWYTPAEYIEKARAVLGEIVLDPASSEAAQEIVQATRFYTRTDDGLTKDWPGLVWLNPPYTQPDISNFVYKLIAEIEAERTTAAILLTHNYTDTDWFHRAESKADLICFTKGRIAFVNDLGEKAAPTQGQAFFYYGEDRDGFCREFDDVGFIR